MKNKIGMHRTTEDDEIKRREIERCWSSDPAYLGELVTSHSGTLPGEELGNSDPFSVQFRPQFFQRIAQTIEL